MTKYVILGFWVSDGVILSVSEESREKIRELWQWDLFSKAFRMT
jgi:hypothetical protein